MVLFFHVASAKTIDTTPTTESKSAACYTDHHAFYESPHYQGDLDLYQVMRAFHEVGFRGPMRPDHGHTIWGEQAARKGYSWPTRAMGASYLRGLWNAIARSASSRNTAQLKLANVAVATA